MRIQRTSVSGLLNVAVIQWCIQSCAIWLNLGHVTGNITMEQILFEALCLFMGRTDAGAKCFHKHFVKPDASYAFLYISCQICPLLGAVAKLSMYTSLMKLLACQVRPGTTQDRSGTKAETYSSISTTNQHQSRQKMYQ